MKRLLILFCLFAASGLIYAASPDESIQQAKLKYASGQNSEAIAILDSALAANPANAQIKKTLADICTDTGEREYGIRNFKNAYEYFKKAVKLVPTHPIASDRYWKMKNEMDVTSLKNEGGVLPASAEIVSKPVAAEKTPDAVKTEVKPERRVPAVMSQKERVVVITDNRAAEEIYNKRMLQMEERFNKRMIELAEQKDKVKGNEGQAGMLSSGAGIIIIIPAVISVLILLFLIVLFMRISKTQKKRRDFYTLHDSERATLLYDMNGNAVRNAQTALPARNSLLIGNAQPQPPGAIVPYGAQAPGAQNATVQSSDPDFFKFESFANGYVYLLEKKYKRGDNTKKIKSLANEIGIQLSLSHEEILELRIIAMLRDIGFLMISENIILKKAGLTKEESMEIFRHPYYSSEMMKAMNMPERIVESISYHHERFDGSGYPNGIKGDDIPLYARIVGLCESYVSITTDKPYKKALSSAEAIDVLNAEKHLFDQEILKVLINIVKETI